MVKKVSVIKKNTKSIQNRAEKVPDTIERTLVQNFVSLQKVMMNLSTRFDNLSDQISKLLDLFEISAKTLAKKDFSFEYDSKEQKEILKKLEDISEQNKTLARGLTFLHESSSEKEIPAQEVVPKFIPKPMPSKSPVQQPIQQSPVKDFKQDENSPKVDIEDYQRSRFLDRSSSSQLQTGPRFKRLPKNP
ncbi:MAG: hypothetical protein ABH811_02150 [archaeon]